MGEASLVVPAALTMIAGVIVIEVQCPLCGEIHHYHPDHTDMVVLAACDPYQRSRYRALHPDMPDYDLLYQLQITEERFS